MHKLNESFFSTIDTEEKAYWLGFILADGNVSKGRYQYTISVGLAAKDRKQLEKLRAALNATYEIKDTFSITKNKRYPSVRLSVNSKQMKDDLIRIGCPPLKTNTATFYKDIEHHLLHHYIRGYFDGDGSLSVTSILWRIDIIGTKDVTENLLRVFKGLTDTKTNLYPKGKQFYCSVGGINYVLTIMHWIYKDATIYLERKYEKYLELQQAKVEMDNRILQQRKALSEALKGRKLPEAVKFKISEAQKGKNKTEEHKQKIKESNKLRFIDINSRIAVSGENSPTSKLTEKIVKRIRLEHSKGETSQRKLASKYSISRSTIKDILQRRTWKYI